MENWLKLIERINDSEANFVKRLKDPMRKHIKNADGTISTHRLAWAADDKDAIVYPEVQEIDGKLVLIDPDKALESAIEKGDIIRMTPTEAEWFTKNYKTYYPGFDENRDSDFSKAAVYAKSGKIDYNKLDSIKATINGKEYNLFVMKSEEEKEYGAKGVSELEDNKGFLFDYRDNPQEEISFWMEDTSCPLDIIFVNDDDEVTAVYQGEPNSLDYLDGRNVSYVIEVAQGSNIKEGDEVDLGEDIDLPENGMFVLNSDGTIQFTLQGNERIFSRISSRVIIRKAKKALASKSEADYKALGRYIFKELDAQEARTPQYVEKP